MTESPEELAAVEQLLAERDALHGWLTRLDQASVAAPETVRDRVRHDYQARLDQLTAGLRVHADVIAGKLHDDRREHDDLFGRTTVAREALAEAELRHAVGEYDASRFDTERVRYRTDIESFELSLAAVAERIRRLEDVHALVERAPPAETAAAATDEPPEPAVHVIEATEEDLVAIADLAPDADGDDLLAIFDEAPDAAHTAADHPTPAPADTVGPLSFRPADSVAPPAAPVPPARTPRAPPTSATPPLGIPHDNEPPRFVRPGERMRQANAAAAPTTPPGPSGTPITEAGVEPQQPLSDDAEARAPDAPLVSVGRTLRCGECGAMNRPLEWYCEKCGAELTAV
jgi:hypothetical protein